MCVFSALNNTKKAKKLTLHHIGKIFISLLTRIKFKIWRVTFLKSFLPSKNSGMVFRFSHNRPFTTCALRWDKSVDTVLCSKTTMFKFDNWTASSEFGTYRICEQRRFRRACASAQSRQNLRCSLIQALSQEEPSDRKPDPWPLRMTGHAQLKFVVTECSKTQIRLTGLNYCNFSWCPLF